MTWAQPNPIVSNGFSFREDEDEYDLKMQFANIVAGNPSQAMMAGYVLFKGPHNYGRAMQAQAWLTDPIVQAEIARLVGSDDVSLLLPSDDEIQKELWNTVLAATDPKVKITGIDLMSKIRGMQKDGGSRGGNVYVQNVIQTPRRVQGEAEEALFALQFEQQQMKLVENARAPVKD